MSNNSISPESSIYFNGLIEADDVLDWSMEYAQFEGVTFLKNFGKIKKDSEFDIVNFNFTDFYMEIFDINGELLEKINFDLTAI